MQKGAGAISLGEGAGPVSGGEKERDSAVCQPVGHGIDEFARHVEVENGGVDRLPLQEIERLADARGRTYDGAAEVCQHILKLKCGQGLVLDHENS